MERTISSNQPIVAGRFRLSVGSFVMFVAVAGAGMAVWDWRASLHQPLFGSQPAILGVFAVCCLIAELRPLRLMWLGRSGHITASWTFMMALLLVVPPITAVTVAALVFLTTDLIPPKAPIRILFNVAQITLSLSLGAAILHAAGQAKELQNGMAISPWWLLTFLAVCVAVYVTNSTLTAVVVSLYRKEPPGKLLRESAPASLFVDGMSLFLAPVSAVLAERSLWLIPLLLVVIGVVYRTTQLMLLHQHQATHDDLTALPNRRLLDQQLRNAVLSAQRRGDQVGLILVNLNGFKNVNDRLGRDIGDQLLRQVASRFSDLCPPTETLAHIGSDKFALVISHPGTISHSVAIASDIRDGFARAFQVEGFPLSLDASFGVAVLPDHAHDSDTLWQRADEAMGQAKRTSHHIAVCGRIAPQDEHSVGRLGLLADLNRAPLDRQLFLEYQPQIDLITGEIMGVEALVRWHHPTAGTLYPAQFVGLAEQTDLIQRVTETVLRQAVIQCVQWAGDGRRPLRVGVNVSARNLQDLQFPGVVREVLRRSGVDPALIDLEITENTFGSNREITVQVLGELRQLGLAISIDDFGTGYSSMSQLRELPISQIKIDRSFVTHMVDNARDRLIVHGILQLAQSLHIETIAEGIEDPQVAAVLRELGCDIAQGWLYGKPMSPELIHR